MRSLLFAAACLSLSSFGCGTPAPTPDVPTPTDAGTTMDVQTVDAPTPVDVPEDNQWAPPDVALVPHTHTSMIGPFPLNAGQEGTWCVVKRLGNVGPEFIRRMHATLGDASHHLIFYRSTLTQEQPTPVPCTGFSGIRNLQDFDAPLLIAQQHDTTLDMPPGVGMNIGANQMVRIEYHAINLSNTTVQVQGSVQVDTVERVDGIIPADLMFWGNVDINIPPRSEGQVHFFSRPPAGAKIFGLTSHTHQHGVLATIADAINNSQASEFAQDITMLHTSRSWSEPPLTLFDPAKTLATDHGLHLVCHYNNTSNATIGFGESFNDEMCFLWAYYYPANRGTHICVDGYNGMSHPVCTYLQ